MTSLREFGTIAFDKAFMLQHIQFGEAYVNQCDQIQYTADKSTIFVAVWFEFVPQVYRKIVSDLIVETYTHYQRQPATEQTRYCFVNRLHHRIYETLSRGI